MLNFFKKSSELKGFKVCLNGEKNKKYGIASDSFNKLKEKIEGKFKIENFELYFNGSLIDDDYYNSIPNQSVIVVVEEGDELKTGK